jgi:NitT/TauT family transport system permease protein
MNVEPRQGFRPDGSRHPPDVDRSAEKIYAVGAVKGVTAARPRSILSRITESDGVRRIFILVLLAAAWEIAARVQNNPLMLPTFTATLRAGVGAVLEDDLIQRAGLSLAVLLKGYAIGVALAMLLTTFAAFSRIGRDALSTLNAMFNPLPAIALLPLAILWFGLGQSSLLFVLVHAVLWPLALNTFAGFQSVPETLRMTGQNYGLKGWRFVALILVPAALPSILSGLKIGWAFAWRTLIAAELVFGASSGEGGLGWYIFQNRNELLTDKVFAGLASVVIIGLIVESVVFRALEASTIRRWGMVR